MRSIIFLSALSAAVLARPQNGPVFPDHPYKCDCDVRTKPNLIQNSNFGKDSFTSITLPIGQNPPGSWFAPHTWIYRPPAPPIKVRNDAMAWQTKSFLSTSTVAGLPRTLQMFIAASSVPGDVQTLSYVPDYLAQYVDTSGLGDGKPGGCACLSFAVGVYIEGLSDAEAATGKPWNYVDDASIKYSVSHTGGVGFKFQRELRFRVGTDIPTYQISSDAPLWPKCPAAPGGLGGFAAEGQQFGGIPQGKWLLQFETGIRKKRGGRSAWLLLDNVKLAWGNNVTIIS